MAITPKPTVPKASPGRKARFSHHRVKGRSGAGGHLDVPAGTSEQQTDGRDQHYHRSKAADAKIVIEGNSQRRPDRHRHIGRHAVP